MFFSIFSFSQSVTGENELYNLYGKADKELNVAYKKLKSKLNESQKIELTNAQKAWIKFRDMNCKFKSQGNDDGGGPYENKMKIDCLIQSTIERTKELTELTNDF